MIGFLMHEWTNALLYALLINHFGQYKQLVQKLRWAGGTQPAESILNGTLYFYYYLFYKPTLYCSGAGITSSQLILCRWSVNSLQRNTQDMQIHPYKLESVSRLIFWATTDPQEQADNQTSVLVLKWVFKQLKKANRIKTKSGAPLKTCD